MSPKAFCGSRSPVSLARRNSGHTPGNHQDMVLPASFAALSACPCTAACAVSKPARYPGVQLPPAVHSGVIRHARGLCSRSRSREVLIGEGTGGFLRAGFSP
ncbi:hypothetical protein AAFF_G00436470 [Aldrovandia affinis]|uniref:Uncharacterized protein n=1 Tax=Aldrovandia affinis TaxID=143900 RepID=A0AAD7WI43_9TELE|nr:hypothetical protein AAFF_G00436470 [Aldrovandia affinis]